VTLFRSRDLGTETPFPFESLSEVLSVTP